MGNSSKPLSPLLRAAISLDEDFEQLARLSAQIKTSNLDSEHEFNHSRKLLERFSECSLRIGGSIQTLAKTLDEARANAEQSVNLVSERAAVIQRRQEENDQLLANFGTISEQVRGITTALTLVRKPQSLEELSAEDKMELSGQINHFDTLLTQLVSEASRIKTAAREGKFKTLESNADALEKSMNSARRKLGTLLERTVVGAD